MKEDQSDEDTCPRDIWPVKRMFRGHLEGVYDLAWSPCSTKVASASVDNSVIVWDVTNGNKVWFQYITYNNEIICSVSFIRLLF